MAIYEPTPEEIQRGCLEIQKGWDHKTRQRRRKDAARDVFTSSELKLLRWCPKCTRPVLPKLAREGRINVCAFCDSALEHECEPRSAPESTGGDPMVISLRDYGIYEEGGL